MRTRACGLLAVACCGRLRFAEAPDGAAAVPQCGGVSITQMFLGHRNTCFLDPAGGRWCVGEGAGEPPGGALLPMHIAGDDGWTSLALGWSSSVGLRDGAVWGWGGDAAPVLLDTDGSWIQIASNIDRFCYRHAAGDVTCDGTALAGTWRDIAAGHTAYCGVQTDGSLWCWGTDTGNMLGQGVEADGTVIAAPARVGAATDWTEVRLSSGLACARKVDGTLWCWGTPQCTGLGGADTQGVPTQLLPDTDWTWFSVHWCHACAGKLDGSTWCWGNDGYGLEVLPGETTVAVPAPLPEQLDAFVPGGHHDCGLQSNEWWCWGWNAAGQLGIGTTTTHQVPTVPLCTVGT